MPNTLAHIGLQSLVTRGLIGNADLKWVWAGCVLPDLPWIAQRVLRTSPLEFSVYDLRLYAVVQSSLLVSLILAASIACISRRMARTFAILALGCLLHLLLDASQTKWANGVLLTAPLEWHLVNFGLYWPEQTVSWLLTALGAAYAICSWSRETPHFQPPRSAWSGRPAAGILLMAAYLALPLLLIPGAARTDMHFVTTLRQIEDRAGKPVAFDRSAVSRTPDGTLLLPWTGESLRLSGEVPADAEVVSLRGRFTSRDEVEILDLHVHSKGVRDWFSYAGLLLVLAWWMRAWRRRH